MSHSFQAPSGQTYLHNGDFSGNIQLVEGGSGEGAVIPFIDIRALYYKYLEAGIDGNEEFTRFDQNQVTEITAKAMDIALGLINAGIGESVDDFLAHTKKIENYLMGEPNKPLVEELKTRGPKPAHQHSGGMTEGQFRTDWARSERETTPPAPEEAEQLRLARAKAARLRHDAPANSEWENGE